MRPRTRLALPAVLLGALLLVGAVGVSGADPVVVEIRDYQFRPPALTVRAGTTVRWVNSEKRQYHSVWFQDSGAPEPEYFFPDESYEMRFDTPGVHTYRCGPHPEMRGTIEVTE